MNTINPKNQAIFDNIASDCENSSILFKRLIPALGYSNLQFANKMRTSRAYVEMLQSDKCHIPGRKACLSIATALEIDPMALNRICSDDAMKKFLEEQGFKMAVRDVMDSPEAKGIMTGLYKIAKSLFEAGKKSK